MMKNTDLGYGSFCKTKEDGLACWLLTNGWGLRHLLLTLGLGNIGWAVIVLRLRLINAVLLGREVIDGRQRPPIAAFRFVRRILL